MRTEAVVLTYHGIGDLPREAPLHNAFVPKARLAQQAEYLARRREVVSLEAAVRDGTGVAITFDDAYASVLTDAAPLLSALGLPATVFIPTRWIGDRNRWDDADGAPTRIMSADELRELERLGFAVESHGHEHVDLASVSREEAERDIVQSMHAIEEITGRRPRYLAYPHGSSSPGARAAAAAAGLEAAFALGVGEGPFARERVSVDPADSRATFALKT